VRDDSSSGRFRASLKTESSEPTPDGARRDDAAFALGRRSASSHWWLLVFLGPPAGSTSLITRDYGMNSVALQWLFVQVCNKGDQGRVDWQTLERWQFPLRQIRGEL
jgi:hypothetical protein